MHRKTSQGLPKGTAIGAVNGCPRGDQWMGGGIIIHPPRSPCRRGGGMPKRNDEAILSLTVRSSNLEERGENGASNTSCHLADKMREISGERGGDR